MVLPMPPCFDCGRKLVSGNVIIVDKEVMDKKPDYDYRLSEKDPKAYLKNPGEYTEGTITVCDICDFLRMVSI